MLVIRAAQFDRFAAEQNRRFEDRVFQHVQRWNPDLALQMGKTGLTPLIARSIERGRECGLITERQLALLTDLRIIAGEDFENAHPVAVDILADRYLSGEDKIGRLLAFVNDLPAPPSAEPGPEG